MTNVGVILSGCGVFDGSEIHEAVATLYSIAARGARAVCLAPDTELAVIDHLTQTPTGEYRRVLAESARIARGDIQSLAEVAGTDFDAIVLPGGFGAAKNLSTFATAGPACTVDPDVERILLEAHRARIPIGFLCIAPAIGARVLGPSAHPRLTIGTDPATAEAINATGAIHELAEPDALVVDEANRIASTPCYMTAASITQVFAGADRVVAKLIEWAGSPVPAPGV